MSPPHFTKRRWSLLAQLSTPLEVALEREMLLREVEAQRQKFYELAMHDPLTGLYNRLALKDPLKRLFAIQDRGEVAALAATMFDIDHFKLVNDTYGHAAGDEVLARVAATFAANARAGDLVARVGGEEFAVFHVVPDGMRVDALAERLRTEVAELRFVDDLAPLRVTVSAGVACRQRGEAYEELLARADTALYRAKGSRPEPDARRARSSTLREVRFGGQRAPRLIARRGGSERHGVGAGCRDLWPYSGSGPVRTLRGMGLPVTRARGGW